MSRDLEIDESLMSSQNARLLAGHRKFGVLSRHDLVTGQATVLVVLVGRPLANGDKTCHALFTDETQITIVARETVQVVLADALTVVAIHGDSPDCRQRI